MAGRGGGDQLRLVRHQLPAARRVHGEAGAGRAMHAGAPLPARSNELSSGSSSSQPASRRGRAVLGRRRRSRGRGTGWPAVARRPTAARPDARRRRRRPRAPAARPPRRPARCPTALQHVPLERPGRVGDDGVLGEEREERRVADGGLREDRRDAVQALELLGPVRLAAGLLRAGPGRAPRAPAVRRPGTSCAPRASRGRARRPLPPHGRRGRAPR